MGRHELLGLSETLILQIAAAGLMFGLHLISARLLPIETYGALSFGLTVGGLLTLLCCAGYPNLVMRQVAAAVVQGTWGLLKGMVLHAGRTVALVSLAVGFLLAAAALAGSRFNPGIAEGLLIALVVVLFHPVGFVRAKLARGLGSIRCSIIPEEVLRPAFFISLLGVAVMGLGHQPDAPVVVLLLLGSSGLAFVAGLLCLSEKMPFRWQQVQAENQHAEWKRSSRRMMFGGIFQEIITRSDLIVLGLVATMDSTGQYSACAKLALLNVFVLKVIDTFYAPRMAVAHANGDVAELRGLVRRTALLSFLGSAPVAAALLMFPTYFLGLFGDGYQSASLPLQILAGGTLINAATGSVGHALLMTNGEGQFARIAMLVAVGNLLGHALFTTTFGIVGAAVVTSISIAAQNLLMLWVVSRRWNRHG